MEYVFFRSFIHGELIKRNNRFVVTILVNGSVSGASLPNPGKLGELFVPGAKLFVRKMRDGLKYPYQVIAVKTAEGEVIMLDTHTNNKVAEYLLETASIESLKDYRVKRREVQCGSSRFDFLLEDRNGKEMYCEVKSCTLFGGSLAMFPDAVTARGKRHIEELASLVDKGIEASVVFVIQSSRIRDFSPDYHTDPDFSAALYRLRNKIRIIPVSAGWNDKLILEDKGREVNCLWSLYENEGLPDRGICIIIFRNDKDQSISFSKRDLNLKPGYYVCLTVEESKLTSRVEYYRRKRKSNPSLAGTLRWNNELISILPVKSSINQSDKICSRVRDLGGELIYSENETLFYFKYNPYSTRGFQKILIDFRMRFPYESLI